MELDRVSVWLVDYSPKLHGKPKRRPYYVPDFGRIAENIIAVPHGLEF
jgi:hypothetical protein